MGWVNAFIFCCIKAKSFTCSFDRWGNKKYDFTRNKYTRQVRTAVLEELNKDYVIGAKARGLSYGKILLRHVFPNSLLPLITLLGLSLGSLLGGTAVVEVIFSYPGLGNLAVTSITAYDYPVIQAYVLWIALIYMIINLIVDLSYTLVDPKVRERG